MSESSDQNPTQSVTETVNEIIKLYKSLPPRPTSDQIQASKSILESIAHEQQTKLQQIATIDQTPPQDDVSNELFSLLQEIRRTSVLFHSHEQRKDAFHLVESEGFYERFDVFVQRVSEMVCGDQGQFGKIGINLGDDPVEKNGSFVEKIGDLDLGNDDSEMGLKSCSTKGVMFSGRDTEKLSLMKVASIIENSAKAEAQVLDLRGKLMDKIEWLPISLGKLSNLIELYLSQNQLMALPNTLSNLKALTRLDVHSNNLINLPDSFEEMNNLNIIDLRGNLLKSLPLSFKYLKKVKNLDLSSNNFTRLPEFIGDLTSLERLNVDTNDLEDVPCTIGSCTSLVELTLNFNNLKAIPETIGKLRSLEKLTLHYNRIKGLPTTIGNLSKLKELDLSFNELESVPENLCFLLGLRKLNLGMNFTDLRALPRSIGNIEMLEELDISGNQIRVLPDSFGYLSSLRVFVADETPLEMPSREVVELGAQAVVKHMVDYVEKRDAKFPSVNKKMGCWLWIFSLFRIKNSEIMF